MLFSSARKPQHPSNTGQDHSLQGVMNVILWMALTIIQSIQIREKPFSRQYKFSSTFFYLFSFFIFFFFFWFQIYYAVTFSGSQARGLQYRQSSRCVFKCRSLRALTSTVSEQCMARLNLQTLQHHDKNSPFLPKSTALSVVLWMYQDAEQMDLYRELKVVVYVINAELWKSQEVWGKRTCPFYTLKINSCKR